MLKSDPSRMNSERLARTRAIIIVMICASIFFFTLNVSLAKAQENSTIAIREMQNTLNNQSHDLEVIKNITSAQNKVLEKVTTSLSKSATQGAYTALSVFFLGIALVVLGLRMSFKGLQNFGKYFNLMVWALTIPVLVLIVIYQFGIATGNRIMFYTSDEPYLVISFLLYIPLGIIIFLLLSHRKMVHQ
jgi:hypothetical protein